MSLATHNSSFMTTEATFSLLTFNCFGGLNWTTPRRLRALARELAELTPTVVCLQEVQSYVALRLLTAACPTYPGQAYGPGLRAPNGSLLTLGRTALGPTHFTRYTVQGPWYGLTLLDHLTQKGALLTQMQYAGLPVVIINTHLVANYGANWHPQGRVARDQQKQLQQLAALVCEQPANALVLVAGDFNLPRGSWLYHEFLALTGLTDPLAGDIRPTYRPFPGVPVRYALPIDFIFIRPPAGQSIESQATLYFSEKRPLLSGGQSYLSDHLGVLVTLHWTAPTDQPGP